MSVAVQTAKRTINGWADDILRNGKITMSESTDLGTIYGNPFKNWCIELDKENKILVLRNERIREKIREFRKYKRIRNYILLSCLVIAIIRIAVNWYYATRRS